MGGVRHDGHFQNFQELWPSFCTFCTGQYGQNQCLQLIRNGCVAHYVTNFNKKILIFTNLSPKYSSWSQTKALNNVTSYKVPSHEILSTITEVELYLWCRSSLRSRDLHLLPFLRLSLGWATRSCSRACDTSMLYALAVGYEQNKS